MWQIPQRFNLPPTRKLQRLLHNYTCSHTKAWTHDATMSILSHECEHWSDMNTQENWMCGHFCTTILSTATQEWVSTQWAYKWVYGIYRKAKLLANWHWYIVPVLGSLQAICLSLPCCAYRPMAHQAHSRCLTTDTHYSYAVQRVQLYAVEGQRL